MGRKFVFLDFLDSEDIRKYNENTEFTPAEQAVLLCWSEKRTIEEKISALQYLADTYTEEEFKTDSIQIGWKKEGVAVQFRETVCGTIRMWKEILADRYCKEGVVFAARLEEKGYNIIGGVRDYRYFSDYETAYQSMVKQKQKYLSDEYLADVETFGEILRIKVNESVSDDILYDYYRFDNEMRLIEVIENDARQMLIGENMERVRDLQYGCYVHVPMPFKAGDIVKVESVLDKTYYGVISRDFPEREEDRYLINRWGDGTDMITSLDIYEGEFDYTDDTDILKLSYCKDEEIPKDQQELKLIRKVRKGEMDFYNVLHCAGRDELGRLLEGE